jgi:hypothetical protein
MDKLLMTTVLAVALSASALSPSAGQNADQRPIAGMMGGGCPMIGMMGQCMMGPGMSGQGMMAGRQARMVALVDGRLAYLKGELNITDAQNEAWNGYANAVKGRVDVMQGMRLHATGDDGCDTKGQRHGADGCPHQEYGGYGRINESHKTGDGETLRGPD